MKLYTCDFEWLYTWGDENSEDNKAKVVLREKRKTWLDSIGITNDSVEHPTKVLLSGEQIVEAMSQGFKLEVKETREFGTPVNEAMSRFELVANKLLALPAMQSQEQNFNQRCDVHMPGQALSTYNEVQLLEDACSDALQTSIDSGWRIIAACPQPNQRRPDYILGRYNPDRRIHSDADRG